MGVGGDNRISVPRPTLAIIGGGFTGAAVAYHLARAQAPVDICVFEPRPHLGAGLAYGGADPTHRINVPASRMSLDPADEAQFARWLVASGTLACDPGAASGAEAYARRHDFGRYVAEAVRPYLDDGRIRQVRRAVAEVRRQGRRWRVVDDSGEAADADFIVIATTHPAPAIPRELTSLVGDRRFVADGLGDDALDGFSGDERVLIVGAGLTAADLIASLDARGHRGPITMISRRGLRSRSHPSAPAPAEGDFINPSAQRASELLRRIREALREAERAGRSWHGVIESLRVNGVDIWAALDGQARRRVARHLRSFWDVHRFRASPQIDAVLERKFADGSLSLIKTRIDCLDATEAALRVQLTDDICLFDRIVLATGPAHDDILRTQSYLQGLAAQGLVALDDTKLGLQTSREGRAIGAAGVPEPTLFVAGPLARGTFGELMGLPAVSIYAKFIADEIVEAVAGGK